MNCVQSNEISMFVKNPFFLHQDPKQYIVHNVSFYQNIKLQIHEFVFSSVLVNFTGVVKFRRKRSV
jgi:hypothetical protein